MKTFNDFVNEILPHINELFPWDLQARIDTLTPPLLIDVREPDEYNAMHIEGSINVPRGILESACEFDYEETVPELAAARKKGVVIICRSGRRSALAAYIMQQMGFEDVYSLKTGLRGWNDFEQPLINQHGTQIDIDAADEFFTTHLRPEQTSQK